MSEPLSSHQIEDVLSSIRRLVSDDLRPKPRAAPVPELVDKLMLTPALRVVSEPAPERQDAEGPVAATPADDGIALSRMAKAVAAWHEDETVGDDVTGDATPDAAVMTAPDAMFIRHRRVPPALTDAAPQPLPVMTAPFDTAVDSMDFTNEAVSATVVDGPGAARIGEDDAATSPGDHDVIQAAVAGFDPVGQEAERIEEPEAIVAPDGNRPVVFRSRRDGAPLAKGRSERAGFAGSPPDASMQDSGGPEVLIVRSEGAEAAEPLVVGPILSPTVESRVDPVDDPLILHGVRVDTADPAIEETASDGHPTEALPIIDATATPVPTVGGNDSIEEAVLLKIVRSMIQAELQGALGERITRNVRKLVRAEIQRVLATRDLD